jgi:excisionase family DNA binding protein
MAQGLEKGGAGVGGLGAELAVGASVAQQMINQPGGILGQATASVGGGGASSAPGGALPELIGPAEAAAALGVSEANVVASLESGDLKGKKIGTEWRITKSALRDFLS